MTTKCLIYCRTSGNDIERDSLSSQADECIKHAEGKGYQVIDILKEDEAGQPGDDMFAPMLMHAKELARQGRFDVLLVRDVTRYTRSKRKGNISDYDFEDAGVKVEFVWDDFGDSEFSEMHKDWKYWASEQERKNIAKRLEAGKKKALDKGSILTHGRVLFGYEKQRIDGIIKLSIKPDEAEIIKLIFKLYVTNGMSIRATGRELNRKRYTTRDGNIWHYKTVRRILTDTAYKGEWHYGKKRTKITRTLENGRIVKKYKDVINDPKTHTIFKIPAIISEHTFDLAQKRIASAPGRKPKFEYLLSKRICCGNCDFSVRGSSRGNGRWKYYQCASYNDPRYKHKQSDDCFRLTNANNIDTVVWDWLENLLKNKDLLREKAESALEKYEAQAEPLRVTLGNIESLLEAKKRQYERLLDIMTQSNDFSLLMDKKKSLEDEITGFETEADDVSLKLDLLNHLTWLRGSKFYDSDGQIFEILWSDEDLEEPLTFEKKLKYIRRYDVRVTVFQDDLGTWLNIESDLGNVLSQLIPNSLYSHQKPQRQFVWIISDTVSLEV